MAFQEDTSAFVDADGPGVVEALWTHAAATNPVNGYLDAPYQDVTLALAGMSALQSSFVCRAADVVGAVEGDAFVVDGTTYEIASDLQPLGDGVFVRVPLKL